MNKNYSLQALRAIAAMLVIFAHSITQINIAVTTNGTFGFVLKILENFGGLGVYVFFIISGYIMAYTTVNIASNTKNAIIFIKKRIVRIYPVYWICLTILIIGWAAGVFLKSHDFYFDKILFSYLLIPFKADNSSSISPVLTQAWTLMYEMFFYLTFSILLLINVKGWKRTWYMFIAYIILYLLSKYDVFSSDVLNIFLSKKFLFLFIVGMFLFDIETKIEKIKDENKLFLGSLFFCSFILLTLAFIPAFIIEPDVIMFLLAIIIFIQFYTCRINNLWLNKLGDASYSIYLTHGFVVLLYGHVIKRMNFDIIYLILLSSIPFILSLLVGVFFYQLVELRLINFFKKAL